MMGYRVGANSISKLTTIGSGIFLTGLLVTGGVLLSNDKDPKQPPAPETEEVGDESTDTEETTEEVVVEQVVAPVTEAPTEEPTEEPTPEPDVCAEHGGLQWQADRCLCEGVMMSTTICQDGKQFDTITTTACSSPDFECSGGDASNGGSGDNGSSQGPPVFGEPKPDA